MRVLVGCESSAVVRDAFRAMGHDAWSCDLLPADDGSPFHYQQDVLGVLGLGWDLMIAHPSCTYLTNSAAWAYGDGPYHQAVKPGTLVGQARREAREEALSFVQTLMNAPIPRIAIENPVGVISTRIKPADQYIQPYDFGDDASKKTGLWLKGLPVLKSTQHVPGRLVGYRMNGKPIYRWGNQTDSGQNKLTPGENRWKERSKTYQGWADAMAMQWGGDVREQTQAANPYQQTGVNTMSYAEYQERRVVAQMAESWSQAKAEIAKLDRQARAEGLIK